VEADSLLFKGLKVEEAVPEVAYPLKEVYLKDEVDEDDIEMWPKGVLYGQFLFSCHHGRDDTRILL